MADNKNKLTGIYRVFVLVEDLQVYRQALSLMLQKEFPGCEIHERENGEDVLELCKKVEPDLVITDLKMPVKDGYHVLKQLFKLSSDYPVMVLTAYATIKTVSNVTLTGCLGFVDKGSDLKTISEGISAVLEGRPYYSPYMHSLIKDYFNSEQYHEHGTHSNN